jgi:nucleoside-diphosphate-sugar epimerase
LIKISNVLVLGSRGQIGSDLCEFLQSQNFIVDEIDIVLGESHDLRNRDSLLEQKLLTTDFVIFLAFDVGGAKYLKEKESDLIFINNNIRIMENVFLAVKSMGIPLLFASSQLALSLDSTYGTLKRLGESYSSAIGGKSIRFWNVYGMENHGAKSHAITDFVTSAINKGRIEVLSNGQETRDFLYVRDASKAITIAMNHYSELPNVSDVASFEWRSIKSVAEDISIYLNADLFFSEVESNDLHSKIEPRKEILEIWKPEIDFESGLKLVIKKLRNIGS